MKYNIHDIMSKPTTFTECDEGQDGYTAYTIIHAETIKEAKSIRLNLIQSGAIADYMTICSAFDCTGKSFTMGRELVRVATIHDDLFIDIHRIGYDI